MAGTELLLAAAAASTAATAAGGVIGGLQQAAQARQQAQLAEENAKAAQRASMVEESRLRRRHRRMAGGARAAFASSGVQIEGSPLDVLADQAMEFEQSALLTRQQGQFRSIEQRNRATMFRSQANAATTTGILTGAVGATQRAASYLPYFE